MKRANKMNITKEAKQFANSLVHNYAKFDRSEKTYELNIHEIPDFQLEAFASHLIQDDELGSDATGANNAQFDKHMMPALRRLLADSTDKDNQIEFVKAWKNGVINYCEDKMVELIEDALQEYTAHQKSMRGYDE